jgi:hypothetical protein
MTQMAVGRRHGWMRRTLALPAVVAAVAGVPLLAGGSAVPPSPQAAPSAAPPAGQEVHPVGPVQSGPHAVRVVVHGPGAVFRVRGEVFGDTGLIDMPESGVDSAEFTSDKPVGQISVQVEVVPGSGGGGLCEISVDGHAVSRARSGIDTARTAYCALWGA